MSSQWPPSNGVTTPTVSRSQSILSTISSINISAPASVVFEAICNTSTYPSWCTFVPRVTIVEQPKDAPQSDSANLMLGTRFIYHVVMDEKKPHKETETHLRVSDVSTPDKQSSYISQDTLKEDPSYESDLSKVYRISWTGDGGLFSGGLSNERFHEIIVKGPNSCEVRTWEVMGGMLARTVKWLYKSTLSKKFDEWCADLKKYAES